jgi:hypothetical protein
MSFLLRETDLRRTVKKTIGKEQCSVIDSDSTRSFQDVFVPDMRLVTGELKLLSTDHEVTAGTQGDGIGIVAGSPR